LSARSAPRLRGIVGLAPRVLPLTPQVAFHLIRTTPFSAPPGPFGSYCALAVIPGPLSRSLPLGNTQSAIARILFPRPVATPGGCSGFFQVRPEPLDGGLPHWLTVATIGFHRLCSPWLRNQRNAGRDSARGWFARPAPLFCRVAGRIRSPPGFQVA
jgi:hypothetical protein